MPQTAQGNSDYDVFTETSKTISNLVSGDIVLNGSKPPTTVLIAKDIPGASTDWVVLFSDGEVRQFTAPASDTLTVLS